jgi:hypothetical protein
VHFLTFLAIGLIAFSIGWQSSLPNIVAVKIFTRRYRWEMADAKDCLLPLTRLARRGRLTLLSAARDLEQSHLPILRQALLEALAVEDLADVAAPSSPPCYATSMPDEPSASQRPDS